MIASILSAIAFALLRGFGVIAISWWWIIPAIILLQIPAAKTILFVIFKMCGLFAMPVSWWFIIIPIFLDLVSLGNIVSHFTQK